MLIISDALPHLKETLGKTRLSTLAQAVVLRFVVAFTLRWGRMSCSAVAQAVATESCHRDQPARFCCRSRWKEADPLGTLREQLLQGKGPPGRYLFIVDATLVSQSGQRAVNTFSTGNTQRRPFRGRRYSKYQHRAKRCHRFTMGLLITPTGARLPWCKPYHTRRYCQQRGWTYRTDAELGAQMIAELPIEADGHRSVVVLADSAYEAKVVRRACGRRNYTWIIPANSGRVYAGAQGTRKQLRSSLEDWSSWKLQKPSR